MDWTSTPPGNFVVALALFVIIICCLAYILRERHRKGPWY